MFCKGLKRLRDRKVWSKHFCKLGILKDTLNYENVHFKQVKVSLEENRSLEDDDDDFSREVFNMDELIEVFGKLKRGKAPGPDLISSEHLILGDHGVKNCLSVQKSTKTGSKVP